MPVIQCLQVHMSRFSGAMRRPRGNLDPIPEIVQSKVLNHAGAAHHRWHLAIGIPQREAPAPISEYLVPG